jgi:hypothetical protein
MVIREDIAVFDTSMQFCLYLYFRDTGTVQQMAGNVSMHPGTNVEIGEQTVQLYSEIQPENIVNVYEQLSSYKNDNPAVDMYQQLDFK